jgi:undecaprenyl-diphosphatase
VVLSGLFQLKDIGTNGAPAWGPTIVATVVAFVVGFASIAWLLRWLVRHTTFVFMVYRVIVGTVVLLLLWTGTVTTS